MTMTKLQYHDMGYGYKTYTGTLYLYTAISGNKS